MSENHADLIIELLEKEGVTFDKMIDLTMDLQQKYVPNITRDMCYEAMLSVINKREVQHAVLTGMELDRLATEGLLISPLQEIIASDFSLYGIDEILTLSITNIYGSIAATTFGYLDKLKPGIIGEIDHKDSNSTKVYTFLDDIVCAIVAATCSKVAHNDVI